MSFVKTTWQVSEPEVDLRELYPAHYTRFHCIASACDFSCCREWKIYADDAVFSRWQKKGIRRITRRADGQRIVRLTEGLNCPHLAEDGLCRMIAEYGEELIPETCRVFPREVREFPDRRERSLMLACPAVVDLLLPGFSVLRTGSTEASARGTETGDEGKAGEDTGGPEASESPEALRDSWMQIIRDPNHHLIINEVDGRDVITTNYVRYADLYVKEDCKWYIKRRRTTFLISDKHVLNS